MRAFRFASPLTFDLPLSPIVCQPSSLRCSSTLFALREGVLLGLHWQRLPPHRAAYRALERVVVVKGAAPAAGGEVFLVDDFLAEGSDPIDLFEVK